ncbi:pirin family protein [Gordonia sp. CPCC 205333]|uniref:pirin family protein n=1 Tax=Gordonia sp. CPCC 205333 TaxID=3140790 RepID=UPI003AF351E9
MTTEIIRSDDRHQWNNEWLDSRQSFPATGNFDLYKNAHGILMVHNDDTVLAGEGLDRHQHRNAEILTWVLNGSVVHRDSRDAEGEITRGVIQRMTAGRGIAHSERNGSSRKDNIELRVIQMWVAPDTDDLDPDYEERDLTAELASGELFVAASGMARDRTTSAVRIANRFAALHIAALPAKMSATLPAAPFGHLYVARGAITFDGQTLTEGDAARFADVGSVEVTAVEDSEILYWEMHAGFVV